MKQPAALQLCITPTDVAVLQTALRTALESGQPLQRAVEKLLHDFDELGRRGRQLAGLVRRDRGRSGAPRVG